MPTIEKFFIVVFNKGRNGIVPGEKRHSLDAASAEKMASTMAPRYTGVAAYAVTVDEENGSMASPRLLVSHGKITDLVPD